ncbi:hypothetical protein JIG36_48630 [Actinoplanes sp. LDG1-06]|uniref:Uncharacterized protein n=1 Tax=Paractinoplanes ovalisporus TaxID=2810368 RepID=A0ABS2AUI9_9ACTN|nr:hypothetical protein [Actinoplanes ovalisporus]MBM2623388.1 hypothetical protein [Actinoplanes ovalisporus]
MVYDDDPAEPVYIPVYDEDRPDDPALVFPPRTQDEYDLIAEMASEYEEWDALRIHSELMREGAEVELGAVRYVVAELEEREAGFEQGF